MRLTPRSRAADSFYPVSLSRRQFVVAIAAAAPILAASRSALAAVAPSRALDFLHTHTGERLSIEYFDQGRYLPDALTTVNHFLRDFRTGDVHVIDPALLDLLHGLTRATGTNTPFQVISGYRSPATNEMLREHSEDVAKNSLHPPRTSFTSIPAG